MIRGSMIHDRLQKISSNSPLKDDRRVVISLFNIAVSKPCVYFLATFFWRFGTLQRLKVHFLTTLM